MDFEISPEDVKAHLDRGLPIKLLDVREHWEYSTASIAGSLHIPMNDLPARAGAELGQDDHLVVFCHSGVRSAHVTAWLRERGFSKVQSMRGGIDLWSRVVDPRVPLY